ncbi:hypothetical protein [Pigmentiphaga aceris]|uniref:hypothetical protein n=1 Tax=Pigmentiphaga aceris TaxID=1940612 RepID=UPI001CA3690B|nr:hypothetical protein [Pigmentiphaga aceris]
MMAILSGDIGVLYVVIQDDLNDIQATRWKQSRHATDIPSVQMQRGGRSQGTTAARFVFHNKNFFLNARKR